MPDRIPTLRELAADLGLDPATVSRGLRNSRRVAPTTRERIQQRAEQLGYRPDPALARLGRHRWEGRRAPKTLNLAVLHSGARLGPSSVLQGAHSMAERLGYVLRPISWADYSDAAQLQEHLCSGGMEGLLITGLTEQGLPQLDWSRFAVVVAGSSAQPHPFDAIVVDTYAQMECALDHCREAGHRRLGVVYTPLLVDNDHRRLAAVDAWARRHRGFRPRLLGCAFVPIKDDVIRFAAWHQRHRFDCLILPNVRVARPLLAALSQPQACVLCTGDGGSRGFAHVRVDLAGMGALAVQHLSHALHHRLLGIPERALRHLMVPQWVDGPSLAGKRF